MRSPFLRIIGVIVAGAIGVGIWVKTNTNQPNVAPGLANVWVSPNGVSPCPASAFSASPRQNPSPDGSGDCSNPDEAYKLAQPGGKLRAMCSNNERYLNWTVTYDPAKAIGSSPVTFAGDGSGCLVKTGAQAHLVYPGNDFPNAPQCQSSSPNNGHCQDLLPSGPILTLTTGSGSLTAGTYYYSVGYQISGNALGGTLPEAPAGPVSSVTVTSNASVAISWAAAGSAVTDTTYFVYRSTNPSTPGNLIATRTGSQLSFTDSGSVTQAQQAKEGYTITVDSTDGFDIKPAGTPYTLYPINSIAMSFACYGGGDATHFFKCKRDSQQQYIGVVGNNLSPANDAPGYGIGNGYIVRQGDLNIFGANDTIMDGFQPEGMINVTTSNGCGTCGGQVMGDNRWTNSIFKTQLALGGEGENVDRSAWVANEDSFGHLKLAGCGQTTGCSATYDDFPRVGTANCIGNSSCHYEASFWQNNYKVVFDYNRCWNQQLYCIFMSRGVGANYGPLRICDNYFAAQNGASSASIVFGGGDSPGLNGVEVCNNSDVTGAQWGFSSGGTVTNVKVYNNLGLNLPCSIAALGSPGTFQGTYDHNAEFGSGSPCVVNTSGLVVDSSNTRISSSSLVWSSTAGPDLDLISTTTPAEHVGSSVNCPSPDIKGNTRGTPCTLGANEPLSGLSVTVSVTGSGTVTSVPAGISCPGTCSTQFPSGTQVSLRSNAAMGSYLASWSGGCTVTTPTCTFTLTSALAATATFTGNQAALAAGYNQFTVTGGSTRAYRLYDPTPLPSTKRPLLVVFPGAGSPGMDAQTYTTDANWLTRVGNANGFSIVILWGYSQTSGAFCATTSSTSCGPRAWNYPQFDSQFTNDVIDKALKGNNIDPRRVYSVGDSAGGTMEATAACGTGGMSTRIAAFDIMSTPISSLNQKWVNGGPIIDKWGGTCTAADFPRSVTYFNGDSDTNPITDFPTGTACKLNNNNPPDPTNGLTTCQNSWDVANQWWRSKMSGCPASATTSDPAGGLYGTAKVDTWACTGTTDRMVLVKASGAGSHSYAMDGLGGFDLYGALWANLSPWSLP